MSFQFPLEYQTPPLLFQHSIEKMNEKKRKSFFILWGKIPNRDFYTRCVFFLLALLCYYYAIAIINIYIFFFSDFRKTPHSVITIWLTSFFLSFLFFYGLIFSGENVPIFHQLVFSVGTTIFWYRDKGFFSSATQQIDNIYIYFLFGVNAGGEGFCCCCCSCWLFAVLLLFCCSVYCG